MNVGRVQLAINPRREVENSVPVVEFVGGIRFYGIKLPPFSIIFIEQYQP